MARKALENARDLDLAIDGGSIVLSRTAADGKVTRLRLTLDDLVFLGQYIPQYLQALIAARREELALDSARDMGFFVPVAEVEAKANEEQTRVLLTLTDERGHKGSFALPPELWRKLSQAIDR
jgi:hypothetical protein